MAVNRNNYIAKINVFLKPTVNDPQGITVKAALFSLDFNVENVRIGKFIEISLKAISSDEAMNLITQMCEKLLANTIIEQYKVQIEELG